MRTHEVPQADIARPYAHPEDAIFGWLQALRSEIAASGLTVGAPRQFSDHETLVGYYVGLTANSDAYELACGLQDRGSIHLRVEFCEAPSGRVVLSYSANLGASADMPAAALSQGLVRARARVPWIAGCFQRARTVGNVTH